MNCKCICHEKDFKLGHDTQCCENMNGFIEELLKPVEFKYSTQDWEEIEKIWVQYAKDNGYYYDWHGFDNIQDFFKPYFLSLEFRIAKLEYLLERFKNT